MKQQPLNGSDIKDIAESIVLAIKSNDNDAVSIIQSELNKYILIPKYSTSNSPITTIL